MVGLVDGAARGWRLIDEAAGGGGAAATEAEHMRRLHGHAPGENQCTSALVKHIKAPVHLGGILFFAPLYLVSLRFALVYFGITFLPLFTLGTT
jgi:hypothetical protein